MTKDNPLYTFDADAVAWLETRMWEAYYARQRVRLFLLLVRLIGTQFGLPWRRALPIALMLARPAMRFARARDHYEAVIPDIAAAYDRLGGACGAAFDARDVAERELRWWIVHRHSEECSLTDLTDAIADLYAAIYHLPIARMQEAARLRAEAARVSDAGRERGGVRDAAYWHEVGDLLRRSYRALKVAVQPYQDGTTLGGIAERSRCGTTAPPATGRTPPCYRPLREEGRDTHPGNPSIGSLHHGPGARLDCMRRADTPPFDA